MGSLYTAQTYTWDLDLFTKLGLQPFKSQNQKKLFVGEYVPNRGEEETKVKIWVTCLPAMFWEFEINTVEGKHFKVQTGTGSLTTFWDSVMLIADNMLTITKT